MRVRWKAGMIVGHWTLLRRLTGPGQWWCRCSCGIEKHVGHDVFYRENPSCGHVHRKYEDFPGNERDKARARAKAARALRKDAGLCIMGDSRPAVPGRVLCRTCSDQRRDLRTARKQQGLCTTGCGTPVTVSKKCDDCTMRHLAVRFGLDQVDCERLFTEANGICQVCMRAGWPSRDRSRSCDWPDPRGNL